MGESRFGANTSRKAQAHSIGFSTRRINAGGGRSKIIRSQKVERDLRRNKAASSGGQKELSEKRLSAAAVELRLGARDRDIPARCRCAHPSLSLRRRFRLSNNSFATKWSSLP